jgi:hypothetical protein
MKVVFFISRAPEKKTAPPLPQLEQFLNMHDEIL